MHNNLLERVPRGLPRRAKTLMLLHNSISEIGRNDLTLLYTLIELNLSYNKLTSPKMQREAFRKLRLLETLDLSGNSLTSMPRGLPRSLHVLEIKNNLINSIPDGTLTKMEKLRKLILSNNQLKLNSVYQGAWMELTALTVSGSDTSGIVTEKKKLGNDVCILHESEYLGTLQRFSTRFLPDLSLNDSLVWCRKGQT